MAFECCHTVSRFRGLTAFECSLLSFDLFRIFLTMHSVHRKSLLLDSYENNVRLCSVLPNITCLFVNEMSEWGWLFLSLSPEPQEATFPLATALSRWSLPSAGSGGGGGTKSSLGKKSLFLPGGDPIPDMSWAAPLSTASKNSISETSLAMTAGLPSHGLGGGKVAVLPHNIILTLQYAWILWVWKRVDLFLGVWAQRREGLQEQYECQTTWNRQGMGFDETALCHGPWREPRSKRHSFP